MWPILGLAWRFDLKGRTIPAGCRGWLCASDLRLRGAGRARFLLGDRPLPPTPSQAWEGAEDAGRKEVGSGESGFGNRQSKS